MTREEAIKILENEKACVNRANKNDYCNRDCYNCELVKTDTEILNALDMAIQAIEQTKWISVSEKLPENNDNVLAWNGRCSMVAWYDAADDDWYSLDDRFVSRRPIKYWVPLPQEPKESEGEWKSSQLWKCEQCEKLIPYNANFCHECADELIEHSEKVFGR